MTAKRRAVDDFLAHRRVPRALADKVKRCVQVGGSMDARCAVTPMCT